MAFVNLFICIIAFDVIIFIGFLLNYFINSERKAKWKGCNSVIKLAEY